MRDQLLADACFSLVSAKEPKRSVRRLQPEPDTHGNFEREDDGALLKGSGKEGRIQQ